MRTGVSARQAGSPKPTQYCCAAGLHKMMGAAELAAPLDLEIFFRALTLAGQHAFGTQSEGYG